MRFDKQPMKMPRDKFIAILGAGVLAVAAYMSRGSFEREQNSGVVQKSGEAATANTETPDIKTPNAETYPVHEKIPTTVFWVGEGADSSNDFIHNRSSAWMEDWVGSFGGVDGPDDRCGHRPCAFIPKENTFYFALPFSDYNDKGVKPASELKVVPWYKGPIKEGQSILKNRWIEITFRGKKAYAQWEDVGPFGEDDAGYVFGTDRPQEPRAGLDVSPAVADYLAIDGKDDTSWRFIDESEVPSGPWKEVVTRSGPTF